MHESKHAEYQPRSGQSRSLCLSIPSKALLTAFLLFSLFLKHGMSALAGFCSRTQLYKSIAMRGMATPWLGILLPVGCFAQGIDIKVPLPIIDDIFGDDERDIQHCWWFWVVIGIIASFFIVAVFFTWRGFRRYGLHQKREIEHQRTQTHEGMLGSRFSSSFLKRASQGIVGASARPIVVVDIEENSGKELARRSAMVGPKGSEIGVSTQVTKSLKKINPRYAVTDN